MNNSPFTQMASVLSAASAPAWHRSDECIPDGLKRTERLRRLLKTYTRPVTAEELAWDMDDHFPNFGGNLVWLLLKHEIKKGRVLWGDGKFTWCHAYETEEAEQLRDAVKLLQRHGYKVKGPAA